MSRFVIKLDQLLKLEPKTDAGKKALTKLNDELQQGIMTNFKDQFDEAASAFGHINGVSIYPPPPDLGPYAIQIPYIDYHKLGIVDVDLAEINCLIRFNFLASHTKNGGYTQPIGHIIVTAVRNQLEETIEAYVAKDSDNKNIVATSSKLKYKTEEKKLTEYFFQSHTEDIFMIYDPNNSNNTWYKMEDFILVMVAELWPKSLDYVNDRFK